MLPVNGRGGGGGVLPQAAPGEEYDLLLVLPPGWGEGGGEEKGRGKIDEG